MNKKTKIAVSALSMIFVLSLASATYAWFISLNKTSAGTVSTALVRWLPESGPTAEDLLTYGSLAAGGSVDPQGVPHVVPKDSLLARRTVSGGVETVTTTLARSYETGETKGTVIHGAAWETADGAVVTRKQRDIRNEAAPITSWTSDGTYNGDPGTGFNTSLYDVTRTAETKTVEAAEQDVITTTTTTTYLPRAAGDNAYQQVLTQVTTIVHEEAVWSDGSGGAGWPIDQAAYTTEETVLYTDETITRSLLRRTRKTAEAETAQPEAVPLSLANASTVPTEVRLGISAVLSTADGTAQAQALELKSPAADGTTYYLGRTVDGQFVELLEFELASDTGYHWAAVTRAEGGDPWSDADTAGVPAWNLWDLLSGNVTAIPAPTEGTGSAPYAAVSRLAVSTASHFGLPQETYETLFNDLFCAKSPRILLQVRFYARQEAYMDWTEFSRQTLDLAFSAG